MPITVRIVGGSGAAAGGHMPAQPLPLCTDLGLFNAMRASLGSSWSRFSADGRLAPNGAGAATSGAAARAAAAVAGAAAAVAAGRFSSRLADQICARAFVQGREQAGDREK